ncbi:MAG: chemotaxis response regulator protein-glutamate methylesterase [Acidimicrobiia bacterium]
MSEIRVLVVDDAVVVRKVVTETLSADPEIVVIGAASNGRLGVEKFLQTHPDVVIMDIEMPEMDGITALKEIRKIDRRVPVIMFSTLTERGAAATLEALAHGASDYVTKPTNSGSITGATNQLKADLIPRVKQLARRFQPRSAPTSATPAAPTRRANPFSGRPTLPSTPRPEAPQVGRVGSSVVLAQSSTPPSKVDIVAIGVSTGGPNALAELLPTLPRNLGVPIVIVQHMPPTFTKLLAERLDRAAPLTVVEASAGMPLRPDEVYIAPGDFHMVIKRSGASVVIDLNQNPPENSCRPAVDVLFRSVADTYGPNSLAVVLTGMGSDGLLGAQAMRARGARILAQDEESSVVWGMPGYVARAGIADAVLPLGQIGAEIVKRTARGAVVARPAPAHAIGGLAR